MDVTKNIFAWKSILWGGTIYIYIYLYIKELLVVSVCLVGVADGDHKL